MEKNRKAAHVLRNFPLGGVCARHPKPKILHHARYQSVADPDALMRVAAGCVNCREGVIRRFLGEHEILQVQIPVAQAEFMQVSKAAAHLARHPQDFPLRDFSPFLQNLGEGGALHMFHHKKKERSVFFKGMNAGKIGVGERHDAEGGFLKRASGSLLFCNVLMNDFEGNDRTTVFQIIREPDLGVCSIPDFFLELEPEGFAKQGARFQNSLFRKRRNMRSAFGASFGAKKIIKPATRTRSHKEIHLNFHKSNPHNTTNELEKTAFLLSQKNTQYSPHLITKIKSIFTAKFLKKPLHGTGVGIYK